MLTLAENVIVAGADNRPPMLDKTQYSLGQVICYSISKVRNMATIQDERVAVQTVQGRQTQGYAGSSTKSSAIGSSVNRNGGTSTTGAAKVIRCYNCQEEGYMARLCTKPKRPKNSTWFEEKAMLAEALESVVVLDEEHMAFLSDNGDTVTIGQASQEIPTLAIFQTDDLDAFDSDCDEAPSASAVLMAKLSAYDSDVLSEILTHDTYLDNQVIDQSVQEMQYSEQPVFINDSDIDITSDSNMISYEQYLKETENVVVQDTCSSTQQDALMYVIKEMSNQVAKCNEVDMVNKTVNESLTAELEDIKNKLNFLKKINI
ncbi:retrovirus-related pol polyprotein from transposon TNT 1-94 [Tanacetum coccineum]